MIAKAVKSLYSDQNHLALLEKMDPCFGVDLLKKMLLHGAYDLYEVYADEEFVGIFLSKLDRLIDGEIELVILHAAAVDKPAIAMTNILNALFEKVAADRGLKSIRVHSDKKGLNKILEDNNFKFAEAIYRKVL